MTYESSLLARGYAAASTGGHQMPAHVRAELARPFRAPPTKRVRVTARTADWFAPGGAPAVVGKVYELEDFLARDLIARGHAEIV